MTVFSLDPIQDSRWPAFLTQHPHASVFHSPNWLRALQLTYGYQPIAYTMSEPGSALRDGWVFCLINSWLTGRRLVSLPFSDHCEPLVDNRNHLERLTEVLREEGKRLKWRYLEYRPRQERLALQGFESSQEFYLHTLDLRPDLQELFRHFHRDSVRRKIRRSERERLIYQQGRSEEFLGKFYHLLRLTRQRHRLPTQPIAWFRNLILCMGDQLKIHIASKDDLPIAAIVTLQFKNTLVYKYGASDARFHRFGGMHLLLWTAIQQAKQSGLDEFDMGRSDTDNHGLIVFKNRWGALASRLSYSRSLCCRTCNLGLDLWDARRVLAYVPKRVLGIAGTLAYRHIG